MCASTRRDDAWKLQRMFLFVVWSVLVLLMQGFVQDEMRAMLQGRRKQSILRFYEMRVCAKRTNDRLLNLKI